MAISRERLAALLSFREPGIALRSAEIGSPEGLRLRAPGARARGCRQRPGAPDPARRRPRSVPGDPLWPLARRPPRDRRQRAHGRTRIPAEPIRPAPRARRLRRAVHGHADIRRRDHTEESSAAKAHIWYGTSLIGQMISEQSAALTYLASRDDVDPGRIGAFGISLGSTLAYWHAALDPRIAAVAHLCCYADYATLVELGNHDNHGIYLLVPGLLRHTSTGEIAGLVAPRPQLDLPGRPGRAHAAPEHRARAGRHPSDVRDGGRCRGPRGVRPGRHRPSRDAGDAPAGHGVLRS